MYEILTGILEPYMLLLVLLLLIILWAWRRTPSIRQPLSLALALLMMLMVLSMPATGYLALGSLEWSYPPADDVPAPSDTVVVLSGDMFVENTEKKIVRLGGDTLYRCIHAARLYKQAGGCRIIVSGGKTDPSQPGPSLAEAMRDFMVEVGVARSDVLLETKSSSTFENARDTAELLREHPTRKIFLVTTASHMKRAARCFQKQGLAVIAAPCNHQALRLDSSMSNFVPSAAGILGVQRAFHEWLGMAWYAVRGRI